MSVFLINSVIFLIAGAGCLVVGSIILNNPPIHDPPGFIQRLQTYLTTNVAETRTNHPFPELELRCYRMAPSSLFTRIEHAVNALGWEILDSDPKQYHLQAVIMTSLLKFKDDIDIHLNLAPCGTELHIRSSSRVGRGDLGANTRHILDLLTTLERQI